MTAAIEERLDDLLGRAEQAGLMFGSTFFLHWLKACRHLLMDQHGVESGGTTEQDIAIVEATMG